MRVFAWFIRINKQDPGRKAAGFGNTPRLTHLCRQIQHQFIEAMHEAGRIIQLAALGQK